MKHLGESRLQETRTTIGDHATAEVLAPETPPRFELLRVETEKADKLETERAKYGYQGDQDSYELGYEACARTSDIDRDRLRRIIGEQLSAAASCLYSIRIAMVTLETRDALVITDKLDHLHFSAQMTVEACAKLLGKEAAAVAVSP